MKLTTTNSLSHQGVQGHQVHPYQYSYHHGRSQLLSWYCLHGCWWYLHHSRCCVHGYAPDQTEVSTDFPLLLLLLLLLLHVPVSIVSNSCTESLATTLTSRGTMHPPPASSNSPALLQLSLQVVTWGALRLNQLDDVLALPASMLRICVGRARGGVLGVWNALL
jgi:hypothetical protein